MSLDKFGGILCPVHTEEHIYRVRYQKYKGRENGKQTTESIPTDWYYCEKCDKCFRVKVSIKIVE